MTELQEGGLALGDNEHGWAFEGHSATAWHDVAGAGEGRSKPYGRVWREGDVVG